MPCTCDDPDCPEQGFGGFNGGYDSDDYGGYAASFASKRGRFGGTSRPSGGWDGGLDRRGFADKSAAAMRREQEAKQAFAKARPEHEAAGLKVTLDLLDPSCHLTTACWASFKKHVIATVAKGGRWAVSRREATGQEKLASGETRKAKCYFVVATYTPVQTKQAPAAKPKPLSAAAPTPKPAAATKPAEEKPVCGSLATKPAQKKKEKAKPAAQQQLSLASFFRKPSRSPSLTAAAAADPGAASATPPATKRAAPQGGAFSFLSNAKKPRAAAVATAQQAGQEGPSGSGSGPDCGGDEAALVAALDDEARDLLRQQQELLDDGVLTAREFGGLKAQLLVQVRSCELR